MNLIEVNVTLPKPILNDGEIITIEHYIKEFKQSDFYTKLLVALNVVADETK